MYKKILLAVLVIVLGLGAIFYGFSRHVGILQPVFKVTDPSNPKFDPYKFKFNDFRREEEVAVLQKLFPVGSDKSFVDRVLVGSGKARAVKNDGYSNVWHYILPEIVNGFGRGGYWVIYDKNGKLLNLRTSLTHKYIHSGQITLENLNKKTKNGE